MIFDDHDVIDDWNTSEAWQREVRATTWWRERVLGGLMSYWVYQHLGNLSPAELADDPLYAAVRAAGQDGGTAPGRCGSSPSAPTTTPRRPAGATGGTSAGSGC